MYESVGATQGPAGVRAFRESRRYTTNIMPTLRSPVAGLSDLLRLRLLNFSNIISSTLKLNVPSPSQEKKMQSQSFMRVGSLHCAQREMPQPDNEAVDTVRRFVFDLIMIPLCYRSPDVSLLTMRRRRFRDCSVAELNVKFSSL